MADHAEIIRRLEDGIAELTSSEEWIRWLDTQRRFHDYSFNNVLLILKQRPDATRVAGFRAWLQMGRHVRKGEKGIQILAPMVRKMKVGEDLAGYSTEHGTVDDDGFIRRVSGFKVAHVFDIAQTDGDDLPDLPAHRLSGDHPTDAYTRLREFAHSIGYTVEEDYLPGSRNGDCNFAEHRIRVEVTNDAAQQVKTLAHELAHALLHDPKTFDGSRELAELEAESVAYVVCSDNGLDSAAYSFGYVAGWAGGGTEAITALKASASRIADAARTILDGTDVAIESEVAA